MNRAAERAAAVADAMEDIAKIDAHGREHGGIDRAGVERIKERLLQLAERDDLFSDEDFPPPDAPGASVSYRIAQNEDDELALYVQCVGDGTAAPPHEHRTWAVIVGMRGQELNRLYGPCVGGDEPDVQREVMVERGTGVAMLHDDACRQPPNYSGIVPSEKRDSLNRRWDLLGRFGSNSLIDSGSRALNGTL